jgi:hypothetical protein
MYFTLDLELVGLGFLRFGEEGAGGFLLFIFAGRRGFVDIMDVTDVVDFASFSSSSCF